MDIDAASQPALIGKRLAELAGDGIQLVIAIKRGGEFLMGPGGDERVAEDDVLIVMRSEK